MSKECDLCGRPLGEWPETRMKGEQRMYAWIAFSLALILIMGIGTCGWYSEKSSKYSMEHAKSIEMSKIEQAHVEAEKVKVEGITKAAQEQIKIEAEKGKVAQYKACLDKAQDPALCGGTIQTVRCLPINIK